MFTRSPLQTPEVRSVEEKVLREYSGVYQWEPNAFVKANHGQFEAKIGSNAEGPTLQRFVPAYFTTLEGWLAKRIRGFAATR